MKKLLLTLAIISALSAPVSAQGIITFKAYSADLIRFTTDGGATISVIPVGNPPVIPGFGPVTIEIWSAADGTVLKPGLDGLPDFSGSGWALASKNPAISVGGGEYQQVVVTLGNGAAGANAEVEIIGFTGTLANPGLYGFAGGPLECGALGWSEPTGNETSLPPIPYGLAIGAEGFNGLVIGEAGSGEPASLITPEPSSFALGGLGAAAFWLFHRRK